MGILNGIIAGNDTMALGAIAAVKNARTCMGIKIVGFDGSPDAVAAIQARGAAGDGSAACGEDRTDGGG
jgi:ABC-type sugar transport system substrate-binding protein